MWKVTVYTADEKGNPIDTESQTIKECATREEAIKTIATLSGGRLHNEFQGWAPTMDGRRVYSAREVVEVCYDCEAQEELTVLNDGTAVCDQCFQNGFDGLQVRISEAKVNCIKNDDIGMYVLGSTGIKHYINDREWL